MPHRLRRQALATSAQDAARFGRINFSFDKEPFWIVEARIPRSFAESLEPGTADTMAYLHVTEAQLPELNRVAHITVHGAVPWVQWP